MTIWRGVGPSYCCRWRAFSAWVFKSLYNAVTGWSSVASEVGTTTLTEEVGPEAVGVNHDRLAGLGGSGQALKKAGGSKPAPAPGRSRY